MTVAETPHVVIIGGGIAGLAAAFYLKDEPVRVTVLEGSPRLGGKLSASDVAGVPMDEGAEALLARRPEGIDLITATGLGGDLVPAGTTSSAIFTRGAMRPLPRRQFMGVPADMGELAATGVVSADGIARARHEERLAPEAADTSVTGYIGARLGEEIVDRLVDPLLGGVYAGRSEELSFQATLAPLAAATKNHASLTEAVTALLPPAPAPPADNSKKRSAPAPVFVTLTTGLGALPEAVAKASNADIRTSAMVRALERTQAGWRLTVGSAADPEYLLADAVIVAAPAAPAARLLSRTVPAASAPLSQIPYASMAIITLAYRAEDFPGTQRSGYLVPAVDGRAVKAATFSTVKWPHLATHAPVHVVRCSVGRIGETALLQRDDADLAALAAAELADATGITARSVARAGHPLGRRAPAVQRRPPGPGGGHPRSRQRAARPRRRGRRLRRRRHPGLRRHRQGGRPAGPRPPQPLRRQGLRFLDVADDEKRLKARDLNELIRYTMWAVFKVSDQAFDREQAAAELTEVLDQSAGKGIVTRGCYDLQGMRADADYMLWWVAPTSDELQEMYVRFRRTRLGHASEPVWSAMALHRPAEFNKGHIPAFLADEEPKNYVSVYPFVRSYEWYLLDPAERRRMLAEHGMMAREYPDVRANTVSLLRAQRLRVDARVRGRRTAPDRRPDAAPARRGRAAAHPGRDPVLHRAPQAAR